MDVGRIYGRGISFPPRIGPDGRVAWSAGPENIREAIRIILLTDPGERLQIPEFGGRLQVLMHEPNTVATRTLIRSAIRDSLGRWEPRIDLKEVTVEAHPDDPSSAIATVSYRLVADNATDQLSLRLQLSGAA